jgi:hypothetical protein
MRKVLGAAPDVTVSLTPTILHVRKQLVMSSVALTIEQLRTDGNNIKLPIHHLSMAKFLQNLH